MPKNRLDSAKLNPILIACLAGDRAAQRDLQRELDPVLRRVLERRLKAWPSDLHGEVLNQFWVNLLCATAQQFDPARGDATTFVWFHLRTAIRQVRASYCPPGSRTRAAEASRRAPRLEPLSLSEPEAMKLAAIGPSSAAAIDTRCDAQAVLAAAPEVLRSALIARYVDDLPIEAAALEVGVSRFTLYRQIQLLRATFQRAA